MIHISRNAAIQRAKNYNSDGIKTSLSFLPVRHDTQSAIDKDLSEYLKVIEEIKKQNLQSDVTIKLHQFGSNTSYGLVKKNVSEIVKSAQNAGTFVWIDQESDQHVDYTIRLLKELRSPHAGICFQSYRKRTKADINKVGGVPIRLVKGFYNDYDIRPWSKVTKNYLSLIPEVAKESSRPCFATHDLDLINYAKDFVEKGEIQFFAGVRDELAKDLVNKGYSVRIYVPYGHVWNFIVKGIGTFDLFRAAQRLLKFQHIR